MAHVKIRPQKNVIDDGFLDLIGREFATHEQGLAEWLKNATDAAVAAGFGSGPETVFLRFTNEQTGLPPVFECIDFIGMTFEDIETGFKPWGRLSLPDEPRGGYGGYGIGGKFYMRQMFESSYLITYSQGRVNIFGFDPSHVYGYAQGYRNRPMNPQEALCSAGVDPLAEVAGLKDAVVSRKRGFSVFKGIGPKGVGKRVDPEILCQRLSRHPQAQRPLRSLRVSVIHNGNVVNEWLKPRPIPRRPGFERPWVQKIPETLCRVDGGKGKVVRLSPYSQPPATLRLFVSSEFLLQRGKMASLNRIDFLGREGVVASYRLDELGVEVPYAESIFGECDLPRLDHLEQQWGRKTRDKLVDRPETRALLQWIGEQVVLFSRRIQRVVAKQH